MKKLYLSILFFCFLFAYLESTEAGLVKKFPLERGGLHLSRSIQSQSYFDSVGQKSAILGTEDGNSEVWIYPYKVLHDFRLYFLMEDENILLDGRRIARRIDVYPHQTIIRYVHSSFIAE